MSKPPDVLIVGSGAAGLTAALNLAETRKVAVIAKGALASFEYTNDRPLNLPETSNLRLVGEMGGSVELTGNVSVTLFNRKPEQVADHVRDYEVSGQVDIHLGSTETTGGFVFSLAGKWMEQRVDTIDASGGFVPDTKGTWKVFQAKLLIPMKGTGAKIPFSVTLANRNELIKEKRIVRANVGVTYDLDMLNVESRFEVPRIVEALRRGDIGWRRMVPVDVQGASSNTASTRPIARSPYGCTSSS